MQFLPFALLGKRLYQPFQLSLYLCGFAFFGFFSNSNAYRYPKHFRPSLMKLLFLWLLLGLLGLLITNGLLCTPHLTRSNIRNVSLWFSSKYNNKLFATVPEHFSAPGVFLEAGCNHSQYFVTNLVAKSVINLLKIIYINNCQSIPVANS